MKRIIVSLLLLIGLLTVGCVNDDPITDQWTHNLYPDSGGNYTIGSSGNPYFEGHFTNLVPYVGATQNLSYGGAELRLDGSFAPVSMSNSSAVNNSIYFSTDNNKLCYKDAGGVVNELY